MERPILKYTYADGHQASEFFAVTVNGKTVDARLTVYHDGTEVWCDRNGLPLEHPPMTDGKETNQSREKNRQGDEGIQRRSTAQRKTGTGKGSNRKKPQAGNRNRPV